ncbi:predicted protein [Naegleria gruberi]|uniref:Predicted protein n=1 Tax=Naegleria gruberi TaxID=5762 RepID=D2V275_NAEGR|nr:uncharacterized protein NAEGRDRAFT_62905 [Naegleria gruberi]EFC49004.1 predicted protein [Naegleria gruberi]|eukprot:XP_002681748.1 predicted protein [Naegleria gruberi strain NEG-M]
MKKTIQTRLEQGEFSILIAPSQSGKTSIVSNSLMPSLKERGYYPVSIDMRGLVSTYLSIQSSSFDTAFLIYINRFLGTQYESNELTSLFEKSSCIPEFKDEKVVLLLDEFDSIAEIPTEERTRFLAALSSMKQNKTLLFSSFLFSNYKFCW